MSSCGVLIVDDSRTMRAIIASTLSRDPEIKIVGQAGDAFEAREAIKRLNPDVVTLDIEMPKMNGLDFLERVMRLRPTPVVVISSLTAKGADVSIRALEIGAIDCIAKPTALDNSSLSDLAARVKAAAGVRFRTCDPNPALATRPASYTSDGRVVAIGASMGGVEALWAILSTFPANCPPTVITQHMPPIFTRSFAERLDRNCEPKVQEASDGSMLMPGHVYIAPGGDAHLEVIGSDRPRCRLLHASPVSGHRPSVDVMFESLSRALGPRALGVILTGMGRDGAHGLLAMREAGSETIGQDERTSLVYGMPRAAFEMGGVAIQLPLSSIGERILSITNKVRS